VKRYITGIIVLSMLVALILSSLLMFTVYSVPRLKEGSSWIYVWKWEETRVIDGEKYTKLWEMTYKIRIRKIEDNMVSYTLLSTDHTLKDAINQSSSFVRCYAWTYDFDKNGKYELWSAFIDSPIFIKSHWNDLKNEWENSVNALNNISGIEIKEEAKNWKFSITVIIDNIERDVNHDFIREDGNITITETVKYSKEGILISLKHLEVAKFEGGDSYTVTTNLSKEVPYSPTELAMYLIFGISVLTAGISGYMIGTRSKKQSMASEDL